MIDFILNRLDLLIYSVVLVAIYVSLLWLWRKVASLETSVSRLDKSLASIQVDKYNASGRGDGGGCWSGSGHGCVGGSFHDIPTFYPAPSQTLKEIVEEENNNLEAVKENEYVNEDVNEYVKEDDIVTIDNTVEDAVEITDQELNNISKTKLQKMSVEGVKEIAKAKGIENTNGTKAEIINKIMTLS